MLVKSQERGLPGNCLALPWTTINVHCLIVKIERGSSRVSLEPPKVKPDHVSQLRMVYQGGGWVKFLEYLCHLQISESIWLHNDMGLKA